MKKKIIVVLLAALLVFVFAACGEQKTPKLEIEETTATSITVVAVEGAEYSKDGGDKWQDSNKFDGLTAATEYSITIRMKATDDQEASKPATVQKVTTLDKTTQAMPTLTVTKTATTITITSVTGAEYLISGIEGANNNVFQGGNKFEGLTPATEYTVAIRLKETATLAASPRNEEKVTTNAATPLATPVAFAKGATAITWDPVTNASKYIVTVDLKAGGKAGSANTVVRVVEFPYEIELTGTSLDIAKLPYDSDLSITVRAANTNVEEADSLKTTAIEFNRGSIFAMGYSEMILDGDNFPKYYAKFQLVQDLVITPIAQNGYTQADAIKAYNNLYNGTSAEKKISADAIGNDYAFMFYQKGVELKEENVFAKNKFWDGLIEKTPGEKEHMVMDPVDKEEPRNVGLTGYTLSKNNEYRTSTTFKNTGTLKASDLYGKTIVMEVGVLLDGVYYGYLTETTVQTLG